MDNHFSHSYALGVDTPFLDIWKMPRFSCEVLDTCFAEEAKPEIAAVCPMSLLRLGFSSG